MRKDRTNAARQARWRERQKPPSTDTVTPSIVTAPTSVTTPLLSHRPHGLVPFAVALAALAVALVSGSFSVIGLTAVFTGAFWPIVGMGIALETAKLSAVAWLGRRYAAPRLLKTAVTMLVLFLMSLSAVGSYGFLTKAHLDHTVAGEAQVAVHQADADARKEVAASTVADFDRRIAQIDSAVDQATKHGRTSAAMALVEHQANRRDQLLRERGQAADMLAGIQVQEAQVGSEHSALSVDYGPVLYLSKLTGINADALMRWFVALVAALLDPLACVLILAANTTDDRRLC